MNRPQDIRCFLAATLSADVLRALEGLGQELAERARSLGARLRWVPADNAHLTLKFFGEIPAASTPALEREVRRALTDQPPIEVALTGVGAFPSARRARVIWVGVHDASNRLHALQTRLESAFEALGFPREPKAFAPHITLARAPGDSHVDVSALVNVERVVVSRHVLRELVVYESDLRPDGARYTPICRGPFQTHVSQNIPMSQSTAPFPDPSQK